MRAMTAAELIFAGFLVYALLLFLLAALVIRGRGGFLARFLFFSLALMTLIGPLALITLMALPLLALVPMAAALLASESFWRGVKLAMLCARGDQSACREIEEARRRLRPRQDSIFSQEG